MNHCDQDDVGRCGIDKLLGTNMIFKAIILSLLSLNVSANTIKGGASDILVLKELGNKKPPYMVNFFSSRSKCEKGQAAWNKTIRAKRLNVVTYCTTYEEYMKLIGTFMYSTRRS